MDDQIRNFPESSSPWITSVIATEKESGVMAFIFLDKPNQKFNIDGNSVHLVVARKGEGFKTMEASLQEGLTMSLEDFLCMLEWFQSQWTVLDKKMSARISKMRQLNMPIKMDEGLYFIGHGSCIFQWWFGQEVLFECRKKSNDQIDCYISHIQRNGKVLEIEPHTIYKLTANYAAIIKNLSLAGYKKPDSPGEMNQ